MIRLIHIDFFQPFVLAFLQCCLPCLAVEGFLVAGFCSAENRTKVFVAVTKVSGGKVECCPKESGESAAGGWVVGQREGISTI